MSIQFLSPEEHILARASRIASYRTGQALVHISGGGSAEVRFPLARTPFPAAPKSKAKKVAEHFRQLLKAAGVCLSTGDPRPSVAGSSTLSFAGCVNCRMPPTALPFLPTGSVKAAPEQENSAATGPSFPSFHLKGNQ